MASSSISNQSKLKRQTLIPLATLLLVSSSNGFRLATQVPKTIILDNIYRRKCSSIHLAVTNVLEEPITKISHRNKIRQTRDESFSFDREQLRYLENQALLTPDKIQQTEIIELPPKKKVRHSKPVTSSYTAATPTVNRKSLEENSTLSLNTTEIANHKSPLPTPNTSSTSKILSVGKQRRRISRSSTMPGFRNRNALINRSHNRDIALHEERTGRKISQKNMTSGSENDGRRRSNKASIADLYAHSATVPDSLVQFTEQIHKESRITPTEEITLGTKTREAIRIQELFSDLEMEYGREPTDDEWCAAAGKINMEALRQTIDEGIAAKNKLVTSNLRMVQGVVNLYIRNGLGSQYNAGDLMQEGTIALIRAAEKYEPERGFRFSTYAMYWIRASVKRSQILQSRPISVPQRFHETYKKIRKTRETLISEMGKAPTQAELATACDLTEVQLERCITAMKQRTYSLDQGIRNPYKPNEAPGARPGSGAAVETTLLDRVAARCDDGDYSPLERRFMKDDLVKTLRHYLPPREVDILLLRYGLMDERTLPYGFSGPLTYSEVSRLVGCKPDKVRRVINNSLKRLRPLIANDWENALG